MRHDIRATLCCLAAHLLAAATAVFALPCAAQLQLVGTIDLTGPRGRLDHLTIDPAQSRLYVAALAAGTVEIIDVSGRKHVARLEGQQEPQGLAWFAPDSRLFVANGSGDRVDAYVGSRKVGSATGLVDADNLRLDASAGRLYVGFDSALAALNPRSLRVLERTALPGHPESFQLAANGPEIYVNVPTAGQVVVIDRRSGKVDRSWPVAPAAANFPMALDEAKHRLFVATRRPATLQVYDSRSGARIAEMTLCGDADDLFFDGERQRLYAVCGEGAVDVIRQVDVDRYERLQRIPTSAGARTGLFDRVSGQLFIAAPARTGHLAQVLIYRAE